MLIEKQARLDVKDAADNAKHAPQQCPATVAREHQDNILSLVKVWVSK